LNGQYSKPSRARGNSKCALFFSNKIPLDRKFSERQSQSVKVKAIENICVAAARREFDILPSSELPDLAATALEVGFDSPSLRALAAESHPTWADCDSLFRQILRELGISINRSSAGLVLATHYARQIVFGSMTPYDGARNIWWNVANRVMQEKEIWNQLRIFVGLASEYEDYPPGRPEFERQIRDEAKRLIERNADF
jgi:hypothetical protein